MENFLKTKGVTWDYMVAAHPEWLLHRVRRFIPCPEELLPRIATVFQKFGPLRDAITGSPLFNEKAWEIAHNALENVRRGFYSDPPGIQLYYVFGKDKYNLTKYRCCRGTNTIEGGVHQNVIRWFGAFNASPDFAVELLRDYTLYHNLTVQALFL